MKDKKNLVIAILGVVVLVLAVLLVTNKKEVKCDEQKEQQSVPQIVGKSYVCTKEQVTEGETPINTKFVIKMAYDETGAIVKYQSGTENKYQNDEEYNAIKQWLDETSNTYEELGNLSMYQYTDLSGDYKDVWYKNILDYYKGDGYNCSNN